MATTGGWIDVNNYYRVSGRRPERGVRIESVLIAGVRAANFEIPIFTFPDQQTDIDEVYVSPAMTIPASPTVYWMFDALRNNVTASGQTRMTSAATPRNTGTAAMNARNAYALGVDQNTKGNTGEVMTLKGTITGASTPVVDMHVAIHYRKTGRIG